MLNKRKIKNVPATRETFSLVFPRLISVVLHGLQQRVQLYCNSLPSGTRSPTVLKVALASRDIQIQLRF